MVTNRKEKVMFRTTHGGDEFKHAVAGGGVFDHDLSFAPEAVFGDVKGAKPGSIPAVPSHARDDDNSAPAAHAAQAPSASRTAAAADGHVDSASAATSDAQSRAISPSSGSDRSMGGKTSASSSLSPSASASSSFASVAARSTSSVLTDALARLGGLKPGCNACSMQNYADNLVRCRRDGFSRLW